MFCRYCGTQMNDGDIFCASCGKRREAEAPPNMHTASPSPENPSAQTNPCDVPTEKKNLYSHIAIAFATNAWLLIGALRIEALMHFWFLSFFVCTVSDLYIYFTIVRHKYSADEAKKIVVGSTAGFIFFYFILKVFLRISIQIAGEGYFAPVIYSFARYALYAYLAVRKVRKLSTR